MANKGETKCLKRSRAVSIKGVEKTKRFLIKPNPGKHNSQAVVSAGYLLKDLLYLADNAREIKYILKNKNVIVDKKIIVSYKFPIGLFDVIEIPKLNKFYRITYINNKFLVPKEISKEDSKYKICKVVSKKLIKNNNLQLVTNDGKIIVTTNKAYKVKASIKINLEENIIKEYFPLEKGRDVLIIGGKHIGYNAKIQDITLGTMQRKTLVKLKSGDLNFETTEKNIIVIN